MSKGYKILLIGLTLMLGILVYLEANTPDPVDWSKTYSIKDKIPYGKYIFFETLKEQAENLNLIKEAPLEFIRDSTVSGTYMFIYEGITIEENVTQKSILEWVEKGNVFFMSAEYATIFDSDSLNIKIKYDQRSKRILNYPEYNFTNPKLKVAKPYGFNRDKSISYFNKIDTVNQTVLGSVNFEEEELSQNEINFIRIPYGKGELLFHTSPEVFSNFFLLQESNYEYMENIFAYLNLEDEIYFDVYLDPNYNWNMFYSSPLYVILLNKYLKWGYYFIIIGVVLFIIFEGKRKQKAIRVISPLKNKSYEFTRSIAGMYLDQKDHTAIARKKIEQFLEYVRLSLRTEVNKIDKNFVKRLKELTDIPEEEIYDLFDEIRALQAKENISKKELKSLNKKINHFKKNS